MRTQIIAAQPLRHGAEGELPLRGVTSRCRRRRAVLLYPERELIGQTRLANARFASHQRERWPTGAGAAPGIVQPLPLALARNERWCARQGGATRNFGPSRFVQTFHAQQSLIGVLGR